MIVHKENIDFDAHCARVIGERVQDKLDPARPNANDPCTLHCLRLKLSRSGGKHKRMRHQPSKVQEKLALLSSET